MVSYVTLWCRIVVLRVGVVAKYSSLVSVGQCQGSLKSTDVLIALFARFEPFTVVAFGLHFAVFA